MYSMLYKVKLLITINNQKLLEILAKFFKVSCDGIHLHMYFFPNFTKILRVPIF